MTGGVVARTGETNMPVAIIATRTAPEKTRRMVSPLRDQRRRSPHRAWANPRRITLSVYLRSKGDAHPERGCPHHPGRHKPLAVDLAVVDLLPLLRACKRG